MTKQEVEACEVPHVSVKIRVTVCDKCGIAGVPNGKWFESGLSVKGNEWAPDTSKYDPKGQIISYDFCARCTASFNEWIKQKKSGGK